MVLARSFQLLKPFFELGHQKMVNRIKVEMVDS